MRKCLPRWDQYLLGCYSKAGKGRRKGEYVLKTQESSKNQTNKKTNWWPQMPLIFPGPSDINESIMASSIHPSISTPVIYHAPLSRPRIESESTRARQGHGPPRGPRCLRPPRPKIARRCRRRGFLAAATNRSRWIIDPNISRYIHSSSHPCGEMEMNKTFYRNLTCDDYRIIIHHGSFMHFTGFVFIPYPSSSSLLITAITLSPTLQCPFNDVLYRCHSSQYITISQHKSDIKWVYSRATCTWPSKNLCPSILAKISSETHLTYSNPSFFSRSCTPALKRLLHGKVPKCELARERPDGSTLQNFDKDCESNMCKQVRHESSYNSRRFISKVSVQKKNANSLFQAQAKVRSMTEE